MQNICRHQNSFFSRICIMTADRIVKLNEEEKEREKSCLTFVLYPTKEKLINWTITKRRNTPYLHL